MTFTMIKPLLPLTGSVAVIRMFWPSVGELKLAEAPLALTLFDHTMPLSVIGLPNWSTPVAVNTWFWSVFNVIVPAQLMSPAAQTFKPLKNCGTTTTVEELTPDPKSAVKVKVPAPGKFTAVVAGTPSALVVCEG